MILEVLPSLMHIAAPALRPVSQHLYSPTEQEAVRCVAPLPVCVLGWGGRWVAQLIIPTRLACRQLAGAGQTGSSMHLCLR